MIVPAAVPEEEYAFASLAAAVGFSIELGRRFWAEFRAGGGLYCWRRD